MEYYVRSDLKDNNLQVITKLVQIWGTLSKIKTKQIYGWAGADSNVIDWEITLCEIAIMNWEMLFKNLYYVKYTSLNCA